MDSLKDAAAQSLEVREWYSTGKALFIKAAQTGDLKTLQFIHSILIGVVNCYHDGITALNAACKEGQNEAVQWLLDTAKADIEKPDMDIAGYRAIHYATIRYIIIYSSLFVAILISIYVFVNYYT